MTPEYILIGIVATINIVAFFVIANDKRTSRRGGATSRIPEGLIFFMAAAAGAAGVYAGMLLFRHKTKKWYFQVGIPLLIFQNLAALYLIRETFAIN